MVVFYSLADAIKTKINQVRRRNQEYKRQNTT
jgi:hypothetical protein